MQPTELNSLTRVAVRETAASGYLSESRVCNRGIVVLVFGLNLILVSSIFFPNLSDITGFAEAAYINDGRKLIQGELTPFGYSPLSSFLYGLTYVPVQRSPYWLI